MSVTELANLVNRLERVAVRLEKFADITTGPEEEMSSEVLAKFVVAYDDALAGPIQLFLQLSNQIGGELKTQVDMVQKALNAQRNILITASKSQAPTPDKLPGILKPISDSIQEIQSFREKNRGSKLINHLSAISEAIPALGWVAVAPTPAPYVKDMIESGQFYTNRVLVEFKEKDKTHCDWARSWISLLTELQAYVKQNHTTGLTWNPKGSTNPVPAGPGGPPPPPPPPPMEIYSSSSNTDAEDARAALFREINKGEGVTSGLRRVDPSQQTHKNPNLRTQSAVPYKPPPTTPKPFQSVKSSPAKPPKFELEGKKWLIENHNGNKNLEVSVEMNQSVHVYHCIDCLLVVKGKLNSIVLDSCKKTAVVFDDIVACVEFINCQSMQAQSMGKVPTINIDKTDGVQIYLSKNSLNCEVVTAKASEINISIPQPSGDFVEHPVPEQFKTTVSGKKLITIPVEQA